jgi:hypothetical protein
MVSGLWKERMTKPVVSSPSFPVILCYPLGLSLVWANNNVEITTNLLTTDY